MKKPVEHLRGTNLGCLEIRLGNIHVMTPPREMLRQCIAPLLRQPNIPKALRRGLILDALTIHARNRGLYLDVVEGRIS